MQEHDDNLIRPVPIETMAKIYLQRAKDFWMRENPKIGAFLNGLEAKGVTARLNWDARRDGKRMTPNTRADVFHVVFSGSQFLPSITSAMIVDYGANGFGLYVDPGHSSSIESGIEMIARPLGAPDPKDAALEFLCAKLEEIAAGSEATDNDDGEEFDHDADRQWLDSIAMQAREHVEAAKKIARGEKPG